MKIGIIGAGQIGGTLTRRLRALGHEVHVANSRDPRTLASLVTETGAVAVEAKDAPRGADLVIVTIPERNVPTLPKGLFAGVPASVVVVDTGKSGCQDERMGFALAIPFANYEGGPTKANNRMLAILN